MRSKPTWLRADLPPSEHSEGSPRLRRAGHRSPIGSSCHHATASPVRPDSGPGRGVFVSLGIPLTATPPRCSVAPWTIIRARSWSLRNDFPPNRPVGNTWRMSAGLMASAVLRAGLRKRGSERVRCIAVWAVAAASPLLRERSFRTRVNLCGCGSEPCGGLRARRTVQVR